MTVFLSHFWASQVWANDCVVVSLLAMTGYMTFYETIKAEYGTKRLFLLCLLLTPYCLLSFYILSIFIQPQSP
jgi:drug/metabolite transporter (DMT)-like permease